MAGTKPGALVVIGGAEDKAGDQEILREFVEIAGGAAARVVVMTVATTAPAEAGDQYTALFTELGVKDVAVVDVRERADATEPAAVELVERATGVYFTGGDQLRITSLLGSSPLDACLHQRWAEGLVIAGTSAGAAVMPRVMIVKGQSDATAGIEIVQKGPGLGLIDGVLIDMHFAERGRIGRLLSAVAEHPAYLGIGIDEDTAIIVQDGAFTVIGSGGVMVVDASALSHTNADDHETEHALALTDVRLHVLPAGYGFNLTERVPVVPQTTSARARDRARTAASQRPQSRNGRGHAGNAARR